MSPSRYSARVASLAVALAFATGCGSTLVDHSAPAELITLVCGSDQVACDGRCMTCPPPANAVPSCAAGACDFTCNAGFNRCSPGSCTAESGTSCGPACLDCTSSAPLNAIPACSAAHACDFQCNPGFLRDGSQCVRALAVSAGYDHACALTATGKVECWGANESGQIGDGTTTDRALPVPVPLPAAVTQVAAGYAHTCALAAAKVYCWGDNTFGEIGDGTTIQRPTPVLVTGLPDVASIGAGGAGVVRVSAAHSCAITTRGSLFCWGANGSGQLGGGGTALGNRPASVSLLPAGFAPGLVACGGRHTCALGAGAVHCWGANDSGQLGIGSTNGQAAPTLPAVASGATFLAVGHDHSCAVVVGSLLCWGLNTSGQVDAGRTLSGALLAPHPPTLPSFLPAIASGGRAHTCAASGAVGPSDLRCFGGNPNGELGGAGSLVSVSILSPRSVLSVTAGGDHTCALTVEGGIQCWGLNDRGQLGRGVFGGESPDPEYVMGR